jgi:hypothetical protein
MTDVAMIVISIAFFGLSMAYVLGCRRLAS